MGRYTKNKSSKKTTPLESAVYAALVILSVVFTVLEGLFYLFLILVAVGIVYSIYMGIKEKIKAKQVAEENRIKEEQRIEQLINGPEPEPELISVSSDSVFFSCEDERVNLAFRKYIDNKNKITLVKAHLDYLVDKAAALCKVGRENEASALDDDIAKANKAYSLISSVNSGKYLSETINMLTKDADIKNAFNTFASNLDAVNIDLLSNFFNSVFYKFIKCTDGTYIGFTPCYILKYKGRDSNITTHSYEDVHIKTDIRKELKTESRQPGDEVASIRYRYEKKDGTRDLRYSDNPATVYLYRGTVTITCGDSVCKFEFKNRSTALEFEKDFKKIAETIDNKKCKNNLKTLMTTKFNTKYI